MVCIVVDMSFIAEKQGAVEQNHKASVLEPKHKEQDAFILNAFSVVAHFSSVDNPRIIQMK